MPMITVTETYDLSTQKDKMGLVSIHTPGINGALINKWRGLFLNYKFYRFVSCDVVCACASTLPADPLQVGVEAGDIAPEDMFNPILFKAVSSQGMSAIEARILNLSSDHSASYLGGESADVDNGSDFYTGPGGTKVDAFQLYYGFLSSHDHWRSAMPQAGFEMINLQPFVYDVVANIGDGNPATGALPSTVNVPGSASTTSSVTASFMLGKAKPMPRSPTAVLVGSDGSLTPGSEQKSMPSTYCACIVVPPSRLHQLFYRLQISWHVEFSELRPVDDIASWSQLASFGNASYYTDYDYSSKMMTAKENSVDARDVDITPIMVS